VVCAEVELASRVSPAGRWNIKQAAKTGDLGLDYDSNEARPGYSLRHAVEDDVSFFLFLSFC
jgi:hypothetical protein